MFSIFPYTFGSPEQRGCSDDGSRLLPAAEFVSEGRRRLGFDVARIRLLFRPRHNANVRHERISAVQVVVVVVVLVVVVVKLLLWMSMYQRNH